MKIAPGENVTNVNLPIEITNAIKAITRIADAYDRSVHLEERRFERELRNEEVAARVSSMMDPEP